MSISTSKIKTAHGTTGERAITSHHYEQHQKSPGCESDIKVVQSDDIGPSQRLRIELGEPGTDLAAARWSNLRTRKAVLDSLLVGKRHMRAETSSRSVSMRGLFDGCYVLLPKEPSNVHLISDELAGVSGEPGAWLNTEFCKIENVKSITLTGTNGDALLDAGSRIGLEAMEGCWLDAKAGEVLDSTKAAQTVEMLNFVDL